MLAYLNSVNPMPEGLPERLLEIVKEQEIARKGHLLRAGRICQNIYFIERGILRCYQEQDSREVSTWFMQEGDICISVESFFRQRNCHENIQALENSLVYYITYEELQQIYRDFPVFNYTGRVLTEKYYLLSEQRLNAMRMKKSHERYEWLTNNFPGLVQRVSSKYLASYLGISDVTFSLIRGRR